MKDRKCSTLHKQSIIHLLWSKTRLKQYFLNTSELLKASRLGRWKLIQIEPNTCCLVLRSEQFFDHWRSKRAEQCAPRPNRNVLKDMLDSRVHCRFPLMSCSCEWLNSANTMTSCAFTNIGRKQIPAWLESGWSRWCLNCTCQSWLFLTKLAFHWRQKASWLTDFLIKMF